MLKRLVKLAELLAAEGDKNILSLLDSKIAAQVRKAHMVPENDETPNPWRRNMDYAAWENSPYYGSVSEFMKKFPGGIKDWVAWRKKTQKERYNQWDANERKAFLIDLIKVAGFEFEDLSGDYEPTTKELELAEKEPTTEERKKAFDLLLRSIDIVKEEVGLSDEEVKKWLEKNLGNFSVAADDEWREEEDPEDLMRAYEADQNTFSYVGEKVPKPILERWKNEWRARDYIKFLKPFSVEDWRITTDDNGEFYLLQALHINTIHEHGWKPKGVENYPVWHTVDKKPTKYSVPNEEDFKMDLNEFNFANDKKFTGYIGPIEDQTAKNKNYRKVIFTGDYGQLVLMSLKPGEEIGEEIHKDTDQFFRIESGEGKFVFNGEEKSAKDGDAVFIPAGTKHNVINTSDSKPFQLYTLYSPPQHPKGTVEKTKSKEEEKDADDVENKGTTINELMLQIKNPLTRLDLLQKLMDKDILSYKWDQAKRENDKEATKGYWTKIMKLSEEIDEIKEGAGVVGPIVSQDNMRIARYGDEVLITEEDSPAMKAVVLLLKEKIKELRALGLDDNAIKHIVKGLFDEPEEMNASDRPNIHFHKSDLKMLSRLNDLKKQLSELEEFNFADWLKRIKDKDEKKKFEDKISDIKRQVDSIDQALFQNKEASLKKDDLLEELSDLEHEQWAHWTKYMLKNLNDKDIEQWKRQIKTKYEDLSEKEKDGDREWANKVLKILKKHNVKLAHYIPEGKDDVKNFDKEPHLYANMDNYESISEYLKKYHSGQDASDAAFDAAKDFVRYWRLLLRRGK